MCYHMRVSRNAYYNWLGNDCTIKQKDSLINLKLRIKEIFNNSRQIYGSSRIQKMLEREDLFYSRSYISVLMRELGLRSILKKKFTVTTDSKHKYPISYNVLNRNFESSLVGEKWVSDITYVRVGDDWNYLTTIIDLADRKVVGWSLSEDMTVENTIYKTWLKARETRDISNNFIFHSDRGVQYASKKMSNVLGKNIKITTSMSRKGNCWDNAVAESFFKTIKYECLLRFKFKSYISLYNTIEDYINWYNIERIHSSLGYLTPLEMEMKLKESFYKNVA